MKLRILVVAVIATLGSGCSSIDKSAKAMRIEPVLSIRHGAPSTQSYYQLGRYFHGQKRLALAEEAYLKAAAANERHVDPINALGSLYAERGEFRRAAQMFERATAMAPESAYVYNNLGFAYFLLGDQEQAYTAVRKALSLDKTLERAWDNLLRIAAMGSGQRLSEAARLRQLEALPSEFAGLALPDRASTEVVPTTIKLAVLPKSGLASELPLPTDSPSLKTADATGTGRAQLGPENAFQVVAGPDAWISPLAQAVENRIAGGRFVLVSASREMVPNGEPIKFGSALPGPVDTPKRNPSILAARLEVSNGNGVARFAKTYSARLKDNKIAVARITNLGSFALKTTVIEFQPGYEEAARKLMERANLTVPLIPAIRSRPGSDIRIVLGRDALQFG